MANWFLTDAVKASKDMIKKAEDNKNSPNFGISKRQSPKKSKLNKEHVFELLKSPDTFATTLLTICLIMYGDETFQVDPLTLYKWLEDDFGTGLSEENESRLAAILVALTTDFFFTDLQTFKSICKTLSTGDPGAYDPQIFEDPPTLSEILWGMYEVALVSDEDTIDSSDYYGAVRGFIDSVVKDNVLELEPSQPSNEPVDGHITVDEYNPAAIISDNTRELASQLVYIGLSDIPQFPTFTFESQ